MRTVEIRYAGRAVALADLPRYAKFYRKLAAGTWEPRTFAVLERNTGLDTTYIDIGSWIGVTPFWAAQSARKVIAVEPDPACMDILRALAPLHPNVTVLQGALSDQNIVKLNAVEGFGSSETSVLAIGDGDTISVPGLTMEQILAQAPDGPLFIKIDIEGYEFAVAEEIAKLRQSRLRGAQIAVHPQLFEKSLKGNRVRRRLLTVLAVWRLGRIFKGFFPAPIIPKYRSLLSYLMTGVLLRAEPKGSDFVFEAGAKRPRERL